MPDSWLRVCHIGSRHVDIRSEADSTLGALRSQRMSCVGSFNVRCPNRATVALFGRYRVFAFFRINEAFFQTLPRVVFWLIAAQRGAVNGNPASPKRGSDISRPGRQISPYFSRRRGLVFEVSTRAVVNNLPKNPPCAVFPKNPPWPVFPHRWLRC